MEDHGDDRGVTGGRDVHQSLCGFWSNDTVPMDSLPGTALRNVSYPALCHIAVFKLCHLIPPLCLEANV